MMLYAPFEAAVCGVSGSGKTTLLTSLISDLTRHYRVGYLKHGAHRFAMDREGKDTWRARESGASAVFIEDADHFACLGSGTIDPVLASALWQDVDILLVEGNRRASIAKIAVIDPAGEILDEIERGDVTGLVAIALRRDLPAHVRTRALELAKRPGVSVAGRDAAVALDADDIPSIRDAILGFFEERGRAVPLYGLVLAGGASSRMQRDKASIAYHGEPQARYAYRLLAGVCERAFVSIRAERAAEPLFEGLAQIHDRFLEIGPMGGILSAMHAHPKAAWMVLGCDLPFVGADTLRDLAALRDRMKLATCYDSSEDRLPEPVCAIYEPAFRPRLLQFLAMGRDCPRKALINSRVRRVVLADPHALMNVNDPEEAERARILARSRSGER